MRTMQIHDISRTPHDEPHEKIPVKNAVQVRRMRLHH